MKSISKNARHGIAITRREASKHIGEYAGIGGGHRAKEANQVTIMGSPEVGSRTIIKKKDALPWVYIHMVIFMLYCL